MYRYLFHKQWQTIYGGALEQRDTMGIQGLLASGIDLVTVFDAILTSRQTCEKLQCLNENLMSNNFRKTAVLKKKTAGLKCRSQVIGQVTGQVTGHRPQARLQVTGHRPGHRSDHRPQVRSGHRSDHRSHTKTIGHWTKLFLIGILLHKAKEPQLYFFCSELYQIPHMRKYIHC